MQGTKRVPPFSLLLLFLIASTGIMRDEAYLPFPKTFNMPFFLPVLPLLSTSRSLWRPPVDGGGGYIKKQQKNKRKNNEMQRKINKTEKKESGKVIKRHPC